MHKQRCLVLGSSGLVGYEVAKALLADGRKVRCVDLKSLEATEQLSGAEYKIGNIYDPDFCNDVLQGIDVVFDFISTTMPNTGKVDLSEEIDKTLKHINYILSAMHNNSVKNYVFPSSGGAVYGSSDKLVTENTELHPTTPYGVGKQMSEDIIKYYSAKCGINAVIFRIGNVYGSSRYRDKPQGVIDVFIQNALEGKPIVLWGNAENVIRDYVFIDDVANAIVRVTNGKISGVEVYNVGTGQGTSLKDILCILKSLDLNLKIVHNSVINSGLNRIIVSSEKLYNNNGVPFTTIRDGIMLTIGRKRLMLCDEHTKGC